MRRIGLMLAVAVAAVGCSFAGGDAPQSTATRSSAGGAQSSTAADPPPSVKTLKAALLTIQDVPTGYAVDGTPDEPDRSIVDDARCRTVLRALDALPGSAAAKASVRFSTGGTFGTLLAETLGSYRTVAEPERAINAMAVALEACSVFKSTESDGTTATNRAAPLSFPHFGSQIHAVRFDITTGGFTASADIITVRVGRCVISIAAGGFTPMPPGTLEPVVRKAVDRLPATC